MGVAGKNFIGEYRVRCYDLGVGLSLELELMICVLGAPLYY